MSFPTKKSLYTPILAFSFLTVAAQATTFSGNYQLRPTYGAIDGSRITVDAQLVSSFPSVQDMVEQGFRTIDGKFAMQMFHFGSGWGFFDVSPEPSRFVVLDNHGSSFGNNGWTIYSSNGRYSTIVAIWDTQPTQLSYQCDDYCIVATLTDPVGFEDEVVDSDEDGLTDPEEVGLGTDKDNPDTDGDGFGDGEEVDAGTSPIDENDTPVVDADGDGVIDEDDLCPDSASGVLVDQFGCSGEQNVINACDCNVGDAGMPWKNHGQYVSCVAHAKNIEVNNGLLTEEEGDALTEAAGESSCGKKSKNGKNFTAVSEW